MQRLAALLALAIFTISLASCGGGSNNSSSTAYSVTLSPTRMTLNYGDVSAVTSQFSDATGSYVYPTATYASSDSSIASVSTSGQVCAGTWDSLTKPVVCKPATSPGAATITVSGGGASANLTVYVHPRVDRVEIVSGSVDLASCKSIAPASGDTKTVMTARAYSGSTDVTQHVGPFGWSVGSGSVAAADSSGLCTTDNTCVITAYRPGQTTIYASLGTAPVLTSGPATFTSCPVESISMHVANTSDTSLSLNGTETQTLTVDAYDSKGNKLVDTAGSLLSATGLSYYSSQPVSTSFTGRTVAAASAGSATTLGAACVPASGCNASLSSVYSNPFSVKVNSGSTVNTTVYVASTTGTSLVPVDTSTNTAGSAITLPYKPNSIAMDRTGAYVYLGSDSGMMSLNTAGITPDRDTRVIGKVISISPDSRIVLAYNPPSGAPGNGTLYRYTVASSTTGASVSSTQVYGAGVGAAASWSPDSSVAYVVTGSKLVVQPAIGAVRTYDLGRQLNDVDFLTQGSFAYLAGAGADVTVRATCNAELEVDTRSIGGTPAFIRSVPNGSAMLALYPGDLSTAAPRYLNSIAVSTTGAGCPPVVTNTPGSSVSLGSFTPGQIILSADSSKAFITATDKATVYAYDVAAKTVTEIQLQGSGVTGIYGGGLTLDGGKLYVGTQGSNALHVINTSNNRDEQQISIGFQPDLVAVRPK